MEAESVSSKTIDRFSGRPEDFGLWHVRLTSVLDELDLLRKASGFSTSRISDDESGDPRCAR